ncbi:Uncharacterised protein [Vibrio cholerae]|nr:Uncharacterised protein [Vibrio cholerae]
MGSTRTLMGRDAFLPWKKMRYSVIPPCPTCLTILSADMIST